MAKERVRLRVSPGALRDRRFVLDGVRQAIRQTLGATAEKLEREIRRQAPKDTGALSKSIRVLKGRTPDKEGNELKMLLYGVFQSEGFKLKAMNVPPGTLDGWVRRKLGISDDAEVRSVAFLIGRKLARIGGPGKGAKNPNRFVDRAIREIGVELRERFRREVKKLRLKKEGR